MHDCIDRVQHDSILLPRKHLFMVLCVDKDVPTSCMTACCCLCATLCGPAADADSQAAAGQAAADGQPYYMKQTIGNACGTIAMLHAIGNNKERAGIGKRGTNSPTSTHLLWP